MAAADSGPAKTSKHDVDLGAPLDADAATPVLEAANAGTPPEPDDAATTEMSPDAADGPTDTPQPPAAPPGPCVEFKPVPAPACATITCGSSEACMGGWCRPLAPVVVHDDSPNQSHPALGTRGDGSVALAFTAVDTVKATAQVRLKLLPSGVPMPDGSLAIEDNLAAKQRYPTVVPGATNTWLVVWSNTDAATAKRTIRARRIAGDGTKLLGAAIDVNTSALSGGAPSTGNVEGPSIATARGVERIFVAWQGGPKASDMAAFVRVLTTDGTPATAEVKLSTPTDRAEGPVAAAVPGGAIVAWSSQEPPKQGDVVVRARRIDHDGVPLGPAVQVTAAPPANQGIPGATAFDDGAWLYTRQFSNTKNKTAPYDLRVQLVGSAAFAGNVLLQGLGADHAVGKNTSGTYAFRAPVVQAAADRAVAAWHDAAIGGSVWLRRYHRASDAIDCAAYDVAGPPASDEAGLRTQPAVAVFASGAVVVAWVGAWVGPPPANESIGRVSLRYLPQ